MKYLDYYKHQLEDNELENSFYKSNCFIEYCALNCFLNSFERSDERLKELIVGDIRALSQTDISALHHQVEMLKNMVDKLPEDFQKLLKESPVEGIIFMIGDSTIDSHGIIIDGKSFMIVDMNAYLKGSDKYNPVTFLVHELSHAIHYHLTPEMYFRNYKVNVESLIKRILVEGLASYITEVTTDESRSDVFWLGYLDSASIDKWIGHCQNKKQTYSSRFKTLIEKESWDQAYQYELFSVVDAEKLWTGRLAYYYGYEIIKGLSKSVKKTDLFKLTYETLYDAFIHYFDVESTEM